jgi:hypothetical protein
MRRQAPVVLYVLALIAVVVGADILFLRHHFWERLMVNVGIVLLCAAVRLPQTHGVSTDLNAIGAL